MVQDEIERQLPSAPTSALRKLLKPAMLEEEEVGRRSARPFRSVDYAARCSPSTPL
jgi:hypothetical protein